MLEFVVGVRRSDSVFLPSSRTGLLVVLVIFTMLFLIAASCGCGHLLDFMASTTMFWSGRSVFTVRWSPGSIIFLASMDTSGIVAGVVFRFYCMFCMCMFCLVCILFVFRLCRMFCMCMFCLVCILCMCIVLRFVLIPWAMGNMASHCVAGTVHLLPRSVIWLWTKSCFMLLSLMNMVPPITG